MAADEQKPETKAEEQQEKKEETEQESNEAQPSASEPEPVAETEQPKVIAFVSPPSREVPSNSAPCLMIETILRMANIPYETRQPIKKSPKTGKFYWISYKGKDVSETSYIVDYLNREFQVDLNESLSSEQCGLTTAYQRLVEENLFWTIVYHKYLMCTDESKNNLPPGIRWVYSKVAHKNTKSSLQAHGMNHHNKEEVYHLAKNDLQAISSYLGEKDFFFGEKPALIDAILFGSLALIVWAMPGSPHETCINEDFTNLKPFCERIKEKYFPDWEDLLAKVPLKSSASVKASNGKIEEQTNGDVDTGEAEVNGEENKEEVADVVKNEAETGGKEVKETEEKAPENIEEQAVKPEEKVDDSPAAKDETPSGQAEETPAEAAEAEKTAPEQNEEAAKENSSDEAEK